jgi:hypothetical protein
VNANPSGRRTFPAGSWRLSEARREHAIIGGPSPGSGLSFGRGGIAVMVDRGEEGSSDGSRHAKKACRGALDARCTAQGRVGDLRSRHIVTHPASLPLLLASRSAVADAVHPLIADGAKLRQAIGKVAGARSSTSQVQRTDRFSPLSGARDTELVQPEICADEALFRGPSRGKGVLAA